MSSALENFVNSRLDYADCNVKAGIKFESAKYTQISSDVAVSIVTQMMRVKCVPTQVATNIITRITESCLKEESKAQIIEALHAKVADCEDEFSDGRDTSKKGVACNNFDNYMDADEWNTVLDPRMDQLSVEAKLTKLAKKAAAMGLHHPTEQTSAGITSIALSAAEPTHILKDNLEHLRFFKAQLKGFVQRLDMQHPLPTMFPADPEEFKTNNPEWYAVAFRSGEHVPSKLSAFDKMAHRSSVPCRSTRGGCSSAAPSRSKSFVCATPMAAIGQPMLQRVFEAFMQTAVQSRVNENSIPGFRVFGGAGEKGSAAAQICGNHIEPAPMPMPQPRLALADGSPNERSAVSSPDCAKSASSQVDVMIASMQDQLAGKAEAPRDGSDDENCQKTKPQVKAKVLANNGNKKKKQTALKRPAAALKLDINEKELVIPKIGKKRVPSHHGCSTIYTDLKKKSWRLKLRAGDKHELYYKWQERVGECAAVSSWDALVKKVREVNK